MHAVHVMTVVADAKIVMEIPILDALPPPTEQAFCVCLGRPEDCGSRRMYCGTPWDIDNQSEKLKRPRGVLIPWSAAFPNTQVCQVISGDLP